jgi:hypothetical protein
MMNKVVQDVEEQHVQIVANNATNYMVVGKLA